MIKGCLSLKWGMRFCDRVVNFLWYHPVCAYGVGSRPHNQHGIGKCMLQLRGLLVGTLSAMLLGGCASANYYTEQGTPITQDTVARVEYQSQEPIIPYSKGKATFNAFSWASEDMQQRIEAKPIRVVRMS